MQDQGESWNCEHRGGKGGEVRKAKEPNNTIEVV